jgi:hypothetical protein
MAAAMTHEFTVGLCLFCWFGGFVAGCIVNRWRIARARAAGFDRGYDLGRTDGYSAGWYDAGLRPPSVRSSPPDNVIRGPWVS